MGTVSNVIGVGQMNERIRELFEQAHIQPPRVVAEFIQWTPPKQFSLEKFAELIVQECVEVCNRIYFDNYPDAEDFERSEEGDAIKQHFGVEE